MIARSYNKRIDFWHFTATKNDFGGSVITDELLFSSWANIKTNASGFNYQEIGLNQFENVTKFSVRFRNDFNYNANDLQIRYKGEKYIIKSVVFFNEEQRFVELLCTKQNGVNS